MKDKTASSRSEKQSPVLRGVLPVLCVVLAIDSAIDDTNTAVAGSTAAAASASGAASSNSEKVLPWQQ